MHISHVSILVLFCCSEERSKLAQIAFEDVYWVLAGAASLLTWRGWWSLQDGIFPDTGVGYIVSHVVGTFGLFAILSSSTLLAWASGEDGRKSSGKGVLYGLHFTEYFVDRCCSNNNLQVLICLVTKPILRA
jgi:hypothetical protein